MPSRGLKVSCGNATIVVAIMILFINMSVFFWSEKIVTFSIVIGILEMMSLCFSMQGEDLIGCAHGRCQVLTFWFAFF